MNDKITAQHLERGARIYVRQSTDHQVRNHHQGRQRQYDLETRARELGFEQVKVIDDDQGKTGSGLVERPGFATLLAAVCSGEVGAVFALEASRLARNNRDWHHLIDLCALTDTLLVDGEGIYDPRNVNDRLLLGLKGTMSEFELNLFRQRARAAFEMKVAARQAMLWFRDHQVPLPEVVPGSRGAEIAWRLPSESHIRQILKNPCYAGALAYGKTAAKVSVINGRARKSNTRSRNPQEKWKVLLRGNHDGYIAWQEFQENVTMLESNSQAREAAQKHAAFP